MIKLPLLPLLLLNAPMLLFVVPLLLWSLKFVLRMLWMRL